MRFCASAIALSEIKLRNLSASYDPTDRIGAQDQIAQAAVKGRGLTGLLYRLPCQGTEYPVSPFAARADALAAVRRRPPSKRH